MAAASARLRIRRVFRWSGIALGAFAIGITATSREMPAGPLISAQAATQECGTLQVNTSWTPAGSPYEICAAGLIVPGGVTLSISTFKLGAVQVNALGSGGIAVYGTMTASSTLHQITFTSTAATPGSWAGLSFHADTANPPNRGNGFFYGVTIHDAVTGISIDSGATSQSGGLGLSVSNSTIDTSMNGINASDTSIAVTVSTISHVGADGIAFQAHYYYGLSVSAVHFDTIGDRAINAGESCLYCSPVLSVTNNTVTDAGTSGSGSPAIQVGGTNGSVTVGSNTVSGSGTGADGTRHPAIFLSGVRVNLGNVTGQASVFANTGSGNGLDAIQLESIGVLNSFSWQTPRQNFVDTDPLGYLVTNGLTASGGMTVGANDVVKASHGDIFVVGHLVASAGGAVFTSMKDSSFDSSKGVLSACPSSIVPDCSVAAGDWGGIVIVGGGDASLLRVTLRYAAFSIDAAGALTLSGSVVEDTSSGIDVHNFASATVSGSVVRNVSGTGIIASSESSSVTVSGTQFVNVGGTTNYAILADAPVTIDCSSIHGNGGGVYANALGTSISGTDLYGNSGTNRYDLYAGVATSARHNWWGQPGGPAGGQIGGPGPYDASSYLMSQAPTASIALSSANANANGAFGKGAMTVTLTFSRKMDTTVSPTVVVFSPNPHPVTGSWQADSLTWQGTYAVDPTTDSPGTANLTVTGARSCVPEPSTNQMAQAMQNFVIDFTTATATTAAATSQSDQGATFNGAITANGWTTTGHFEYGVASGQYPNTTADQAMGNGSSATAISQVVTGLTPGTTYYYRTVAVTGNGTTYGVEQSFATTFTLHFPALMNNAFGGYTTTIYLQNKSGHSLAADAVTITYYDQTGGSVGTGDSSPALADGQVWVIAQSNGHAFSPGSAGSGRVNATAPLAGFVNQEIAGGDGSSYSALAAPATGTTVFAPTILHSAYGAYTTSIGITNAGAQATTVTVTYTDQHGVAVGTQSHAVAANAFWSLYQGDVGTPVPAGFSGAATISTSPPSGLAAIVNEINTSNGQFLTYTASPAGQTTLYAPAIFDDAYGGYNTAIGIENLGSGVASTTIKYTGSIGNGTTSASYTQTVSIAAGGSAPVYNGGGASNPVLPDQFHGSAVITSDQPVIAIVNEVQTGATYGTSYNTVSSGTPTVHLPLVENAYNGFNTGIGVENVGTGAATVTVAYLDPNTGSVLASGPTLTLQPGDFAGVYQGGTSGVPAGTRAAAVLTVTNLGGGGALAVIVNQQSVSSFMSYSGQ